MLKKIKKSLALGALALVAAAASLTFAPVRAFASKEGSYIYNQLILRPFATTARATCSSSTEGYIMYDSTVHSIAWCDGTNWHKLVSGNFAVSDYWTTY